MDTRKQIFANGSEMMKALSEQKPDWHIAWADQTDLYDLASGYVTGEMLKQRVINRIVPIVLNAAISAGLIEAKQ